MSNLNQRYLFLDDPLNPSPYGENGGISALQNLYPGRPMPVFGRYDLNEIPNEDPIGAAETYMTNREETHEYARQLFNRALEQGGGDKEKVLVHALDDPNAFVENPDLPNNMIQAPPVQHDGQPFPAGGPAPKKEANDSDFTAQGKGKLVERYEGGGDKHPKEKAVAGKPEEEGFWSATNVAFAFIAIVLFLLVLYFGFGHHAKK
jgi:hypothetical protein